MSFRRPVNIIQGGKKVFIVRIKSKLTRDPFDLTGAIAITTCFLNTDNTELELSLSSGLSILSAVLGKIQVTITAGQAAALADTQGQPATLEFAIDLGSGPVKVQIPNAYLVAPTVC